MQYNSFKNFKLNLRNLAAEGNATIYILLDSYYITRSFTHSWFQSGDSSNNHVGALFSPSRTLQYPNHSPGFHFITTKKQRIHSGSPQTEQPL